MKYQTFTQFRLHSGITRGCREDSCSDYSGSLYTVPDAVTRQIARADRNAYISVYSEQAN